jgi:hypothetical protein
MSVSVEGRFIVAEALTRLAIARSVVLDETMAEVYLQGLVDIEPSLVVRAATELARTRRKGFEPAWPPLADLRDRAIALGDLDREQAVRRRLIGSEFDSRRGMRYCAVCGDDGAIVFLCPGTDDPAVDANDDRGRNERFCDRAYRHPRHSWCRPCECVATNPVILDRQFKQKRHAGGA